MNEETVEATVEAPVFITVPAKVQVKIGKRNRTFANESEALVALEKFNSGAKPVNKGIMAARKAAIALKATVTSPLAVYVATLEGLTDKSKAQRVNVLYTLCVDFPAIFEILTGTAMPEAEIVEPEASLEVSTDTTETEADPEADPLADLL